MVTTVPWAHIETHPKVRRRLGGPRGERRLGSGDRNHGSAAAPHGAPQKYSESSSAGRSLATMVTSACYPAHAHTYSAGLPPGSDCPRVIAQAQRAWGAARGGGALVRGSPPGSGVRGRVAPAPASCRTTRTSECGSEAGFAGPRVGRVKREPGWKEAEEPGVGERSRRGAGLPRGPRSWSREGRGAKSTAGGWAQKGPGSRVQRISGDSVFQQTSEPCFGSSEVYPA